MRLLSGVPVTIRAIWIVVLITVSFSYYEYIHVVGQSVTSKLTVTVVHLLFVVSWVYSFLRLTFFLSRTKKFFRRLLAGDYETGIRDSTWLRDEVSDVTQLINKTSDQLRVYDELRSERTGASYRLMDTIFKNVNEPIAIVSVEKQQIRLNPHLKTLYDVTQDLFSFEAMEKPEENRRFIVANLYRVLRSGVGREGYAPLRLPIRELVLHFDFRMVPFKNKQEKVTMVLVFMKAVGIHGEDIVESGSDVIGATQRGTTQNQKV